MEAAEAACFVLVEEAVEAVEAGVATCRRHFRVRLTALRQRRLQTATVSGVAECVTGCCNVSVSSAVADLTERREMGVLGAATTIVPAVRIWPSVAAFAMAAAAAAARA